MSCSNAREEKARHEQLNPRDTVAIRNARVVAERFGNAFARSLRSLHGAGPRTSIGTMRSAAARAERRTAPRRGATLRGMTSRKTLYLANPYGFSAQQRGGPLTALVAALEAMGRGDLGTVRPQQPD